MIIVFSVFRYNFEVTDQDIDELYKDFGNDLTLPENFEHTAPTIDQQRSAVTEQVFICGYYN